MVHEGSLNHWKVQKDFLILCSSIDFIRYSYTSTIKTHNKKTEQRKHGKQGGGEDNNTVCGTMQPKAMKSHTPHVHKVHMHVPKTQRYQTERPEFRERDSEPS